MGGENIFCWQKETNRGWEIWTVPLSVYTTWPILCGHPTPLTMCEHATTVLINLFLNQPLHFNSSLSGRWTCRDFLPFKHQSITEVQHWCWEIKSEALVQPQSHWLALESYQIRKQFLYGLVHGEVVILDRKGTNKRFAACCCKLIRKTVSSSLIFALSLWINILRSLTPKKYSNDTISVYIWSGHLDKDIQRSQAF